MDQTYRISKASRRTFARGDLTNAESLENLLNEDSTKTEEPKSLVIEQVYTQAYTKLTIGGSDTKKPAIEEDVAKEIHVREESISALREIKTIRDNIQNQYDDTEIRQIYFVELKEKVNLLTEQVVNEKNYFAQVITLLSDALNLIKSEELSKQKLDGIGEIINVCEKVDLDREDARHCGKICRENKISTLPSFD